MRYAAIGDSFTEGIGDELPDGTPRGWADLVAAGLAASSDEPMFYANLAVRGRLLGPIVHEQVPEALALTPPPTLVTLNGGGNDIMRPGVEPAELLTLTEQAVVRFQQAGVRVVLLSGADPSDGLPFGRTIHRRGIELTAGVADLARRYGTTFVDAFGDAELRRGPYWSPDRLHLGPAGHRRVADLVLTALGHPPTAQPAPSAAAARTVTAELRYYRQHVLPWLTRRLRGQSSGDGRSGRHATWERIEPS
ncbi:MAG TPA: SGNH/GDSL hydrolase family protein [Jatrophihabitans sp.]|nr:SGNH/GDSL hydrolase family protein [Jatrophihabitans sp.]